MLDSILDEAVREFEEEEEEVDGDDHALEDFDRLVDNLRNPAYADTIAKTLRTFSGNDQGLDTIENLPRRDEDNLGVASTMESLAKETHDMEGMDTAQFAASGEQLMTDMIAQFEKLGQKEDFDQVVDNVMRQLLAKDLMYEPMKLVCDTYPEWLAEHRDGMTEDEYARYGAQYQYFQRIVAVYQREPDNFNRLVELLQDLQNFGQPPAEIIKDLAPGLEFNADGMPIMNFGDNVFPPSSFGSPPQFPGGENAMPVPPNISAFTTDPAAAQCSLS